MAIAPSVALLDVNETLSDLSRLGQRFEEVGAPAQLLPTWFAATLRDGMALTASGEYAAFRDVARAVLRGLLSDHPRLHTPSEEAVEHVLGGMGTLPVQADVADGLRLLCEAGIRVATLTNGAPAIAQGLLERAGLEDMVERNIGVEEVGRWKPAPEPYRHACRAMGVEEAQAMLIAAHPWDVHGAKRAGLRAGWVNRHGRPYPEVFAPPDVSAGDLPALARALAG
jgi:2-haloacid dehalogenase